MDDRSCLELDSARAVVRAAREVLNSSPSTLHENMIYLESALKCYDLVPPPDFARGIEELRELGRFDGVDANAYVAAVRGGEPYTMPDGRKVG